MSELPDEPSFKSICDAFRSGDIRFSDGFMTIGGNVLPGKGRKSPDDKRRGSTIRNVGDLVEAICAVSSFVKQTQPIPDSTAEDVGKTLIRSSTAQAVDQILDDRKTVSGLTSWMFDDQDPEADSGHNATHDDVDGNDDDGHTPPTPPTRPTIS